MSAEDRIAEMIAPTLEDMGFDIVRIKMDGGSRQTLQIMADRLDETPMTIDDCADISHAVSALMDVEDPISGAYNLEVSTPGIDRPLTRLRDFERFSGLEAKVEMQLLHEGRRHFRGRLKGLEGDAVAITLKEENGDLLDYMLPFGDIRRAKLVMNDELMEFSAAQLNANADAAEDPDVEQDAETPAS